MPIQPVPMPGDALRNKKEPDVPQASPPVNLGPPVAGGGGVGIGGIITPGTTPSPIGPPIVGGGADTVPGSRALPPIIPGGGPGPAPGPAPIGPPGSIPGVNDVGGGGFGGGGFGGGGGLLGPPVSSPPGPRFQPLPPVTPGPVPQPTTVPGGGGTLPRTRPPVGPPVVRPPQPGDALRPGQRPRAAAGWTPNR